MNIRMDIRIMAVLAAILAGFQGIPLLFAWLVGEDFQPLALSLLIALGVALAGLLPTRGASTHLHPRDGFLVASLGWSLAAILGAAPYFLSGWLGGIDALFESTAGFTTTGSSVLRHPESWPLSLLLWRSLTQWLGGMGMLLLTIAILPVLGVGGMQLMKAEVPGPNKERLVPRLAATARLLWGLYVGFTVLAAVLYTLSGMSSFDALNHAFTTMATGGFSTRSQSLAAFSPAAQWWCVLFMIVAGTNFLIHYRLLVKRDGSVHKEPEWQFFLGIILVVGLVQSGLLWQGRGGSLEPALREGFFQTVSVLTTTGYANANWEMWPAAQQLLLVILMLIGGMAGSTGGGVKVIRVVVLLKLMASVARRLLQPNQIVVLKVGSKSIAQDAAEGCVAVVVGAVFLALATGLALNLMGMDMTSAMGAALTCVSNVGPGLGSVGPTDDFALVPDLGKFLLAVDMVAGRLEIFTVLMLFSVKFWRW